MRQAVGFFVKWGAGVALATALILLISDALAKCFAQTASDEASWVQAIGATITIVSAVAVALWQQGMSDRYKRIEEGAAAEAAHNLAHAALEIVGDRLQAALSSYKPIEQHGLRGFRTTEMVAAIRHIDPARVPTPLLAEFINLRTQVFAINERITELYRREENPDDPNAHEAIAERHFKLQSAVRVYNEAVDSYAALQTEASRLYSVSASPLSERSAISGYSLNS